MPLCRSTINPPAPLSRHAILITLDYLAASLLGAYGQYRVRTPALDQLASHSAVFHNGLCHAVPGQETSPTADWETTPHVQLLWAECESADVPIQIVQQSPDQPAREWVRDGVDAIRSQLSSDRSGLTWIQGIGISDPWVPDHSGWDVEVARLLATTWEELLADESPEMTPELAIQELVAEGHFSRHRRPAVPDRVANRLSLALYTACVEKLDERLGRLIREFQRHAQPESLLLIAGLLGDDLPREWPVQRPVELHTELVRVPLIVQTGAGHAGGSTVLELVQTTDIAETLAAWLLPAVSGTALAAGFSAKDTVPEPVASAMPLTSRACEPQPATASVNLLAVAGKTAPGHPFVQVTSHSGETLLRTPEAQLVTRPAAPAQDETDPTEWLTLKPEDAWDLLNVADQHHDLVETLRQLSSGGS